MSTITIMTKSPTTRYLNILSGYYFLFEHLILVGQMFISYYICNIPVV